MGLLSKLKGLVSKPDECEHLADLQPVTPSHADGCPQCLELGDRWVNLRVCLVCGQVGCCDNSKNKHATGHWRASGHPIIQSYQPGELWRYCYADEKMLADAPSLRK